MKLTKQIYKQMLMLCTSVCFCMLLSFAALATEDHFNIDISGYTNSDQISHVINEALASQSNATITVGGQTTLTTPSTQGDSISVAFTKSQTKLLWEAKVGTNIESNGPLLSVTGNDALNSTVFEFDGGILVAKKADSPLVDVSNVEFVMNAGFITNTGGNLAVKVAPRSYNPNTNFTMKGGYIASCNAPNGVSPALYFKDIAANNMQGGFIYSNAARIIGEGVQPDSVIVAGDNTELSALGQTKVLAYHKVFGITKYMEKSNTNLSMYPSGSNPQWSKGLGLSRADVRFGNAHYPLPDTDLPEVYQFQGSVSDVEYDGQPHGMSVTDAHNAPYALHYVGIDGTNYNSIQAPIAVGKYKVNVKVTKQNEFAAADVDDFARFEIRTAGSQGNNNQGQGQNNNQSQGQNNNQNQGQNNNQNQGQNNNQNQGQNNNQNQGQNNNQNQGQNNNQNQGQNNNQNQGQNNPNNSQNQGQNNNQNRNNNQSQNNSRNRSGGGRSGNSSRKSSAKQKRASKTVSSGQWMKDNKGWRFKNANGTYPRNTWQQLPWNAKNEWYFFDEQGYMVTGWKQLSWNNRSDWYLFHSSGQMLTGWQLVNGKWYYLYEKTTAGHPVGSLATNTMIGVHSVNADGVWIK